MSYHWLTMRKHWIFDMDGTLTIAHHDFDAIRAELGLPKGLPILEALSQLPEEVSKPLSIKLDEIELELAHQAKPAEGAKKLLDMLLSQGTMLGIVTRNNSVNIAVTLKAAGLADYFLPENCVSRNCALPKPSPAGIFELLNRWQAKADDAVMVGDYIHDIKAGSAAGAKTIYIDPSGQFPFKKDADICIKQMAELMAQS